MYLCWFVLNNIRSAEKSRANLRAAIGPPNRVTRNSQFPRINVFIVRRYGIQALDRVGCHVALPERVAELASVNEAEAASMIQGAVAGLRSLHDFMRLAGVVQKSVVCLPREDSRPQLDSLDEYSWSLVRRYLFLDDIGTPRRGDAKRLNAVDAQ